MADDGDVVALARMARGRCTRIYREMGELRGILAELERRVGQLETTPAEETRPHEHTEHTRAAAV